MWKDVKKFPILVQRCCQRGFRLRIRSNLCNSVQAPAFLEKALVSHKWRLVGGRSVFGVHDLYELN